MGIDAKKLDFLKSFLTNNDLQLSLSQSAMQETKQPQVDFMKFRESQQRPNESSANPAELSELETIQNELR